MPLILEQSFPLGRYHATRWNQNPFEDRHGEWPPSPWRLLRALAARWFQYARETGDEDTTIRDELLQHMAAQPPAFHLPEFNWRGEPAPRQYHKTEVGWTDASANAAAYKKSKTTLVVDDFRAISSEERIAWVWNTVELSPRSAALLGELSRRVLYFGRAESWCRIQMVAHPPTRAQLCELSQSDRSGVPVLAASVGERLNLASLLASSDDRILKGRQIPPGSQWFYARLPQCPRATKSVIRKSGFPRDLQTIQFAAGGRVFPAQAHWVRVIEKFRGSVLKHAARIVSNGEFSSYRDLPRELRDKLRLLSGKDGEGVPNRNLEHAYFFLRPDEFGNPTKLIACRHIPFDEGHELPFEVEAILAASRAPIFWQSRDPDWSLRLVPLPFETPTPHGCGRDGSASTSWISATPFVPPRRHRFRRDGRLRAAETAVKLLRNGLNRVLHNMGSTAIVVDVQQLDNDGQSSPARPEQDPLAFTWTAVHEPLSERRQPTKTGSNRVRPGFRFRVEFSEAVYGPLLVGHSCHFGLGQFMPVQDV